MENFIPYAISVAFKESIEYRVTDAWIQIKLFNT